MKTYARLLIAAPTCMVLTLGGISLASATPAVLSNAELDGVSAGAVTVTSSADSAALGALTIAGTTANSFALHAGDANAPDLGVSAGVADGTAVAAGTNPAGGTTATGAATNVQTGGVADGNFQVANTVNYTVQGAGGVQFQAGWTAVFGAWLPR